jgi:putative peptidoglycan lipid II flippase
MGVYSKLYLFLHLVLSEKGARKIILFPSVFVSVEIKKVMVDFWLILRPLLILPVILQGNITLERALSSLVGLDAVSSLDYAKFITETVIFFYLCQLRLRDYQRGLV